MKYEQELNEFINNCQRLININSVLSVAQEKMPFGQGIDLALDEVLKISQELGYEVYKDPQGYYGYAQIGQGELFGVLSHVDVVPEGDVNNWQSQPYEMSVRDNIIYGRGIEDDKGPTLLCLHALKILLDNGRKLNKRVRFIFGTDEETLWRCLERYNQIEETPAMGFTPDSIFPLTYAEKGLYQFDLSIEELINFNFCGGEAYNSVPSQAFIKRTPELEQLAKNNNVSYQIEADNFKIIGLSAHVKDADVGTNAIVELAKLLKELNYQSKMLDFIVEKGSNPNGELLFGNLSDSESGKLMFNIGKASFENNKQTISVDMRIPVSFSKEVIDQELAKVIDQYDLTFKQVDYAKPLYVDPNSFLVKSLMKAYTDITKDYAAKPLATGGATFARTMPNCVSFGPTFAQAISSAHQANESVSIEDCQQALEIYLRAFELLVLEEEK